MATAPKTKKATTAKTKKATAPKTKNATTAKTTAEKKSTDITVTGNKKIGTLRKEFNKKFPYLNLGIFPSEARDQVAKGGYITSIGDSQTLASVRRANSGGEISISGNKKVKTLEKEFDTVFGLYCQIGYRSATGNNYYTTGATDEKTLAGLNAECEKNGCEKGGWK